MTGDHFNWLNGVVEQINGPTECASESKAAVLPTQTLATKERFLAIQAISKMEMSILDGDFNGGHSALLFSTIKIGEIGEAPRQRQLKDHRNPVESGVFICLGL